MIMVENGKTEGLECSRITHKFPIGFYYEIMDYNDGNKLSVTIWI